MPSVTLRVEGGGSATLRVGDGGAATLGVEEPTSVTFAASQYVPYVPTGHQYDGSYEVTPTMSEQSLETRDRTMTDDVTVHAVPLYEVGNEWGTTVYIATLEG